MRSSSRLRWFLLLLFISVVAAAIRTYRLTDYPPGLHYDEAFHQVEAIAILEGYRPVYFPENMGMDALHIYLIALLFRAFGVSYVGGRIISAIAGTLTIPATWWMARELFAHLEEPRRLALSASSAFVLATLQWHVTFSRTGIQPVLVPLLLTLTMASLWRGLRTGGWGWFAAAGVFLGAGPYAYSASRFVPLLIVGLTLWLALFDRQRLRRRWHGLAISIGVSALVFAPLGLFFLEHPQWFTYRAGQITSSTLGPGAWRSLWDNALRTMAAFSFRGDRDVIRNLPGRPALDAYLSILFALGVGTALYRIRHPAWATLLGWIAVMSLPTILTEYAPHFGRSLGVTPAVALLVGLGADRAWWLADWLGSRWWSRGHSALQKGVVIALSVGLIASGVGSGYAYFVRWGSLPDLYLPYDVALLAAGREVRERAAEATVYLSPISVGHPILRFLLWDRPGPRSYDGRHGLVLPPNTEQQVDYVIVSTMDRRSLPRLEAIYRQGGVVERGMYEDGEPYYQVYRVPAGSAARLAPQRPLQTVWGGRIALLGYDLDQDRYQPGETALLTLYWRSLEAVQEPYTVFAHLLGPPRPDSDSPVWAGDDHEPGRASYPTSAWQPGEAILDEYALPIPPDAPPGPYDLEVGLYQWPAMQRLAVSSSSGMAGADYAILGQLIVEK